MSPVSLSILALLLLGQVVNAQEGQRALALATSSFAQKLFPLVCVPRTNCVFSPASLHVSLTLTHSGAQGQTATEMSTVLGLHTIPSVYTPHTLYHDLIQLYVNTPNLTLRLVNGIFVTQGALIRPDFVQHAKNKYFARVAPINLSNPRRPINDWVANATEQGILNLLPPGSIDAQTSAVLVNAIYFNGAWETPFKRSKTRKQTFTRASGNTVQVDLMTDIRRVLYKRDEVNKLDVVELNYRGGQVVMDIVLPWEPPGISDLEHLITVPGEFEKLFEGLEPTWITIGIPKFSILSMFRLKAALQTLGIVQLFDPVAANLNGISRYEDLFVSEVIHYARIQVAEGGTLAAAGTAGELEALSTLAARPPVQTFIADHPFLFVIRHKDTGSLLFEGRFSGY